MANILFKKIPDLNPYYSVPIDGHDFKIQDGVKGLLAEGSPLSFILYLIALFFNPTGVKGLPPSPVCSYVCVFSV